MPLIPGSRLGPYEILGLLGEGGMGQVYRARDTQLDRDVAIKILPELFAADPDRVMRFEREAKALAALNHPNIAQIHGVERSGTTRALVMELVEGEDLAQQIARGPVPIDQAVGIARQMAAGLEGAHEAGLVHRDLKPANVKVRDDGTVKVLDFGLAKALDSAGTHLPQNVADSPTLTSPALTQAGVLLGTAAYMAPEQARGRAVDKRADIWAFGCVLYELVTGQNAFAGETVTDTLSAIITRSPDLGLLPAGTPAAVRRLIERCLERDPKRRLRDIGEARIALEAVGESTGPSAGPLATAPRWRTALPWSLAALAILMAVGVMASRAAAPGRVELPPLTVRLALPGLALARNTLPSLSPDGRRIAYVANGGLWTRDLDRLEPRQVTGVDAPRFPFWSPDGRQIAYVHDGALWRVPAEGGRAVMVAAVRFNLGARTPGGVWRPDGTIVFTSAAGGSGLLAVSDEGGEMRTLHAQDSAIESDFHRPSLLPDGDSLLFAVDRLEGGSNTIGVLSRGERKDVLTLDGEVVEGPVYSPTGHILYTRETTAPGIWAVPFSLTRMETTGAPFLVVAGASWPAVTPDGTLVYADLATGGLMQLAWVDPEGARTPAFPGTFPRVLSPRLSPDGHRLAAVVLTDSNQSEVTLFDLRRQTRAVLERGPGIPSRLAWLGNDRLVLTSGGNGPQATVVVRQVDGAARDEIGRGVRPDGSRDGRALVFVALTPGNYTDLWHRVGDTVQVLLGTRYAEDEPALSPDATLLAYISNETGQEEVFLQGYPEAGAKIQVSSGGGRYPRWSPTGDRIYYRDGTAGADGTTGVLQVSVDRRSGLTLGSPRAVTIPGGIETYPGGFDIAPDGARLIVVQSAGGGTDPSLVVMQNWAASTRP